MKVGIVGITGYTGLELVRLVLGHPKLELVLGMAGASAGQALSTLWPALHESVDLEVEETSAARIIEACELVFLAMPHGKAALLAPKLLKAGVKVIDLGADFRLKDPSAYKHFYGIDHPSPDLLHEAVYGLVELERDAIKDASLIANPGCYPTAVTLAAHPLIAHAKGPVIASCLSGVSGAGRSAPTRTRYCETSDQARPYAIGGTHRHTPEMEQNLQGSQVVFTPHLAPMSRGIIASVFLQHKEAISCQDMDAIYRSAYADEAMIVLRDEPPSSGDVRGSNRAHIHVKHDPERMTTTIICAIDNLLKGAAGQAMHSLNIMAGFPETEGIPMLPMPI